LISGAKKAPSVVSSVSFIVIHRVSLSNIWNTSRFNIRIRCNRRVLE